MRPLFLLCLAGIGIFGTAASQLRTRPVLILIGGNVRGYLSPCGCTKPMSGGLRRRMTLVRQLSRGQRTLFVENGGFVRGIGKQDRLKVQALAEALDSAGVDAIHLTRAEADLGPGGILSISNLAPGKLVNTHWTENNLGVEPFVAKDGFLIGGFDSKWSPKNREMGSIFMVSEAIEVFTAQLVANARTPLLLVDGTESAAQELVQRIAIGEPRPALAVYQSYGKAPQWKRLVQGSLLVSPGEGGHHLVAVQFANGRFLSVSTFELDESIPNDPATSKIYARYLNRVTRENLLSGAVRNKTAEYAGNAMCMSCHEKAAKVWKRSKHAQALATLQSDGHHRDPDCVGCHVVGLESEYGYRNETQSPQLKNVGCESCHGPGRSHAEGPTSVRMPKVGAISCNACHVKDHSPTFEFRLYWKQIAH